MPSLFDTFRFTANDGSGDQSLTPIVSDLVRRWEREGDGRAYRVKLSTRLIFKGADYTYFRDLYDAGDCVSVSLLIENYCDGDWQTWFEGNIPIFAGEYNATRCEVTFEIKPADVYECANKGFGVRTNWLEYADPQDINTIYGTIETTTCHNAGETRAEPSFLIEYYKGCWDTGFTTSSDPDPDEAWRPISHEQDYFFLSGPEVWKLRATTTWARETVESVTEPPGGGWINIGGDTWVRPVLVGFPTVGSTSLQYGRSWQAQTLNSAPISNGRPLGEVLEAAVAALDCDIDEVISNFFNINPDATNPSNAAYDYAADNFTNVFIFQKSDIVRATASNDATLLELALRDFFEEIRLLSLFYSITIESGVKKLRIEHYTYFDGSADMNLVTLDGGKYIAGLDAFKVENEVPAFEAFAYQESFRPKFLIQRIDYPADCATQEGQDHAARLLCADVGGLLENPDAGLDGFVLVATHDLGDGEWLLNTLGGEANGCFAWENLLPALWADGRYHLDATSTVGAGYVVNSVRKSRVQGPITVKFCCDDSFEPSSLVTTQIGDGEVKSAEQSTQRGTLKLELLQ